jgi:hypothetical protein
MGLLQNQITLGSGPHACCFNLPVSMPLGGEIEPRKCFRYSLDERSGKQNGTRLIGRNRSYLSLRKTGAEHCFKALSVGMVREPPDTGSANSFIQFTVIQKALDEIGQFIRPVEAR